MINNVLSTYAEDTGIRFCVQYPDYTTFKSQVEDNLVLASAPAFGYETLYTLLFRRFQGNRFRANNTESIDYNMQDILDRLLPKYNKIWNVFTSDYYKNLTAQDLLQEGILDVVTQDTDNGTDDTTSSATNKLKESPQLEGITELNTDYLSSQQDTDSTVGRIINNVKDITKLAKSNTRPVYARFYEFNSKNISYELQDFYKELMQIFRRIF